jgi:peptidoglycan LD-endopeptidase LytH
MDKIGWPLRSNQIRRGLVNHTFGMVRRNPDGTKRPHQGWDFYAAPGTPCFAVSDGKVALIRTVGDYGNTIVIQFTHNGDTLYAAYSHLSRIDKKLGDTVKLGEQIGLTGNTGNAVSMRGEDCHLHFELRNIAAPGKGISNRLSPLEIFRKCPLDGPIVVH